MRRIIGVVILCAALGALLVVVARILLGQDPAGSLASILGLRSGIVLGALLGGLLGAWLALGGTRRVAGTAGFLLGAAFIFGVWLLAEPFLWVVDVVMQELFGEGGEQYSGLAQFFIAILLFRAVAVAGTGLVSSLVERQRGRGSPSEKGQS